MPESGAPDEGTAPLIVELWNADINTVMSCQDDSGRVWVKFASAMDAEQFPTRSGRSRHSWAPSRPASGRCGVVVHAVGRPDVDAGDDGGERSGAVIGFARVTPYSDRCVYEGVGEFGVYVGGAARGRGVGRALLAALCEVADRRGYHKLTSRIFTTNEASRALHRAAGFVEVGIQRRHGQLDDEWRDCALVERLLGAAARDNPPAERTQQALR